LIRPQDARRSGAKPRCQRGSRPTIGAFEDLRAFYADSPRRRFVPTRLRSRPANVKPKTCPLGRGPLYAIGTLISCLAAKRSGRYRLSPSTLTPGLGSWRDRDKDRMNPVPEPTAPAISTLPSDHETMPEWANSRWVQNVDHATPGS
jgi:hypothetical protein